MALTVGGLFSGIGGWELGLERAGMGIAWHCEADPFCRRVLERHWPGVPCFEDVRTLSRPPYVDVLAGGFPCQDLSVAGKGAGIDGARSGLWSEFARLIGEVRPRYVCVENVSALLGRGLGRVLGDLAALGYDAEWDCLPASAFGAPHRRDRVWLVAYPAGAGLEGQGSRGAVGHRSGVGYVADAHEERRPQRGSASESMATQLGLVASGRAEVADPDSVAGAPRSALERGRDPLSQSGAVQRTVGCGGRIGDTWEVEPDVGRVADGVPARVDRLRSLGNALVPQIAQWIGGRIVAYEEAQRVAS